MLDSDALAFLASVDKSISKKRSEKFLFRLPSPWIACDSIGQTDDSSAPSGVCGARWFSASDSQPQVAAPISTHHSDE